MSDSTISWIKANIKWLLMLVFLAGSNFALMAFKIDSKIDKSDAEALIKAQVTEKLSEVLPHYYNNTDGKVLESKYEEIIRRLDNIEKKLNQ